MEHFITICSWFVKNKLKNTEYLSKRTIVNCNFVANGFQQLAGH